MTNAVSQNRVRNLLPGNWSDFEGVVEQLLGPNCLRSSSGHFTPASLWEDADAYHVELDVPGVTRENIELELENGALTITSERPAPDESRNGIVEERRFGKTTRTVALPESIDVDSIEAELINGVLHVTVAKKPEALPKRIEIK